MAATRPLQQMNPSRGDSLRLRSISLRQLARTVRRPVQSRP